MRFKSFATILFILFYSVWGWSKSLDQIVHGLATDLRYSPFVIGEKKAQNHPIYPELIKVAQKLRVSVDWKPSVSAAVLELPNHPERMVVQATDEFDGWFDEFTSPQKVIIHNKATMIILIHELRHALHLGNHGKLSGSWFDQLLQKNKKEIDLFKKDLKSSSLSILTQKKLQQAATRLIETCSEISAHQGDLFLSEVYQRPEAVSYAEFIQEYKKEFIKNYKLLKRNSFSENYTFIDDLNAGLLQFMQEKSLE